MRGTVLDGRYTLTERIGAGGMGAVWRARDARLDRDVAVKLLGLPRHTSGPERERMLALFVREARAAAALDSSYIVPVFDHGADGDVPYLVMPLLTGRTVNALLTEGDGLAPERVADIAGQVCRALAVAHRAGIVHRDIKPANVIVTDEGTVKVLDFGIAKFLDATGATGGYLTRTSDSPIGTLHYMAPERFTRGPADGRTDVYSLGCMVHEMLTGSPPFDAPSEAALMHCHVYEAPDPPSARRPELTPEWDAFVGRTLTKDPTGRPSADEARQALDALARTAGLRPVPTPPPAPVPAPQAAPLEPVGAAEYPLAPPMPQGPPTPWPVPQPLVAAGSGPRPWWRRWWLPAGAAVAVAALVAVLAVVNPFDKDGGGDADKTAKDGGSGSSDGRGTGGGKGGRIGAKGPAVAEQARTETLTIGTAADSKGPSPAVGGARRGGSVTVLDPYEPTTIDPGMMWSGAERLVSRLVYRSLTGLKTLPDGSVKLVGDLATDAGRPTAGGRTWTFTLKEGLTYNDGLPVRAKDFAHAVERTLGPQFSLGDKTVRSWLLGKDATTGTSARSLPPGAIETPNDRTIVFHLEVPRSDFNVALAGPTGAPLPDKVKNTPVNSGTLPSTGPYQINAYQSGKDLVLTRNPAWRATTDPLRTAYPDSYRMEGGVSDDQIKSRTLAARPGEAVMTFTGTLAKGDLDKASGAGRLTAPSSYVQTYMINTQRVKNRAVRKAIATALPAADVLAAGGENGTVQHNLLPPGVRGAHPFDLYDAGERGSPAKARALLKDAGKSGYRITLGYGTEADAQRAEVIEAALKQAGFRVELKQDKPTDYFKNAGDGKYDLFRLAVGGGLPVASSFLPDYFDSETAAPASSNYSRLKNSEVDDAIEAADGADSVTAAGELWSRVDRRVMEEAAAVPLYVPTRTFLHSEALRGLQVDLDGVSPLNAYVRR
ncbi:ABC transporter substrate-binding protein [Streptomyces sp. NPDC053474]|uniref:ABC transporter substrate-binding protein n=1 Tax=Streptomyces sp. NPDC053474 TaxID=3365704 RepID=UPI0037D26904